MRRKLVLLIVGLLAVSVASAVLVTYLSNKAVADVDVNSPISNQIIGDSSFSIYGGETVTVQVATENLASVPITGSIDNFVENPLGLNCSDFVSVVVTTHTNGTYIGTWDLIALGNCIPVNATTVQFLFGPQPQVTWQPGQLDEMEINASFKTNALGKYTFTSQVMV